MLRLRPFLTFSFPHPPIHPSYHPFNNASQLRSRYLSQIQKYSLQQGPKAHIRLRRHQGHYPYLPPLPGPTIPSF